MVPFVFVLSPQNHFSKPTGAVGIEVSLDHFLRSLPFTLGELLTT